MMCAKQFKRALPLADPTSITSGVSTGAIAGSAGVGMEMDWNTRLLQALFAEVVPQHMLHLRDALTVRYTIRTHPEQQQQQQRY